jgi:hypothetical protein
MSLSDCGQRVIWLPHLRSLDLSGNQLPLVPQWLPPSLIQLNLSKNMLNDFPDWACEELASLQLLALHGNHLKQLPSNFTQLTALKALCLEANPMTDPELTRQEDTMAEDGILLPGSAAWALQGIRDAKYAVKRQSALRAPPPA